MANTSPSIESAVTRIRALNDQIVASAKRGGEESIKTYERMLEDLAQAQEAAGARSADWITEFARAQAAFTRQLATAFPSLIERLGTRGRELMYAATSTARSVPGVGAAEGAVRGAASRAQDLPIPGYDDLNADQIVAKVRGLADVDLGRIFAYETRTKNRKTVLDAVTPREA